MPTHHRHLAVPVAAGLLVLATGCENDNRLATKPEPPVAVIAGPETASPLMVATFDGSGSYSEQSVIVAWSWSLTGKPGGSHAELVQDPADPQRSDLSIDIAGDYEVTLRVEDERGMDDTAAFRFSAVPWQTVHVELLWDRDATDLDLHLVSETEGGAFYAEPFDCYFENTNPDWGTPGVTGDDPSIDVDDVDGYGPENANLNLPRDGHRYRVLAHYYDDRGLGASTATVRIFLSGELRFEGIRPLDRTGAGWDVATIEWPSGAITSVDTTFYFPP